VAVLGANVLADIEAETRPAARVSLIGGMDNFTKDVVIRRCHS